MLRRHSARTERIRHERHLTGSRMVVGLRRQVVSARAVDGPAGTAPRRPAPGAQVAAPAYPRGADPPDVTFPTGPPAYGTTRTRSTAPRRARSTAKARRMPGRGIWPGRAGTEKDERVRDRVVGLCLCRVVLPPGHPGRRLRLHRRSQIKRSKGRSGATGWPSPASSSASAAGLVVLGLILTASHHNTNGVVIPGPSPDCWASAVPSTRQSGAHACKVCSMVPR